uniref:Uncharacterized protein n=1 Tax=Lutzomyia longipalpis TaxID=7200 RepID=A0A1B0CVC6_LUTLO
MATVLLEARPYRPFKSSEEYLYAMREDLAEWLNTMYPELRIMWTTLWIAWTQEWLSANQ